MDIQAILRLGQNANKRDQEQRQILCVSRHTSPVAFKV